MTSQSNFELGLAVAAVETGTLNRAAALLIRSGFSSRLAAIKAVADLNATFSSGPELRAWLRTKAVREAANDPDWPTPETHHLWVDYVSAYSRFAARAWNEITREVPVKWRPGAELPDGVPVRLETSDDGATDVLAPDHTPLGKLDELLNPKRCGLAIATVIRGKVAIEYLGPDKLQVAS